MSKKAIDSHLLICGVQALLGGYSLPVNRRYGLLRSPSEPRWPSSLDYETYHLLRRLVGLPLVAGDEYALG